MVIFGLQSKQYLIPYHNWVLFDACSVSAHSCVEQKELHLVREMQTTLWSLLPGNRSDPDNRHVQVSFESSLSSRKYFLNLSANNENIKYHYI